MKRQARREREASRLSAALASLALLGCRADDVHLGDGRPRVDAATEVADAQGGYGAPTVIETISHDDTGDDDPSLTSDLTAIYFNSKRAGGKGKEECRPRI